VTDTGWIEKAIALVDHRSVDNHAVKASAAAELAALRARVVTLETVISDYIDTCGCAACSSNKTGKHPERCEDCEIPAFEAALKEET